MVSPKRIASRPFAEEPRASGPQRQRSAAPGPRRRGSEQVLGALALLIVGGLAGAGIIGLVGRAASESPAPIGDASVAPTDDLGAAPSDDPGASEAPVSPVLEARMPTSINGVTLTVQSAVDATTLSGSPDGRALNAAIVHLGKQATDLEIAVAFDDAGALDLTILGFRTDGVAVADMRAAVLSAWLAADAPGVTSSSLNWSGTTVTKVAYGDGGADEYVATFGDSVFVLETSDAALAQAGVAALAGAPAASAAPAGSAAPASASPTSSPGS